MDYKPMTLEERKSITLFFCDIYGTVDGGFTEQDCKTFAELLQQLKENEQSDYLLFGMLSTEQFEIVKSYEEKISKYFQDDILLINKFQDIEALKEAKLVCALYYIDYLKKYFDINGVYCADDITLIHEMFRELLLERENIELNSIIPSKGENNLKFLNEEIKRKIDDINLGLMP